MRAELALLFCLFLAACATDPYSQIAAGQAALEATQVAKNVQAEQTRGALDAFAIERTQYAGEVLAVEAQLRGTQEAITGQETAIAMQATKAQGDLRATSSHATAEAIRLQTTAGYLVQYGAAMSTATAIVKERELAALTAKRDADRANALRWVGILSLAGLAAWSVFALVVTVDVIRRRSLADAAWKFYRAAQVAELPDSLPPDNGRTEITEFLHTAATVAGREATLIPRYDVMGLSAERWTKATNILQSMGLLIKIKGKGSYIRMPYRNIGGLYQAVTTGRLQVAPLPTVDMSQRRAANGEQNTNGA